MGRFEKTVLNSDGIDKRKNGYYSTPRFVADFISQEMVKLNPHGQKVFDPCVGKEELLDYFFESKKEIDSIDIEKYCTHNKSHFEQKDFFELYAKTKEAFFIKATHLKYDYYIANPPYNCHESEYISEKKNHLKKLFKDVGIANMYSMFISAIIDLAKDQSIIGLITNDSFLTSRIHAPLRRKILNNCIISHLILCPVDLFRDQKADVRTCIIILKKQKNEFNYKVNLLNRPQSTTEFKNSLCKRAFSCENIQDIVLTSKKDNSEFVIGCPKEILPFFQNNRIGDIFNCVTGISTGNDSKYLSKEKKNGFSIPFYKNPGKRRFYTSPDAFIPDNFIEIDKNIKNFMVRNKRLLFKSGITCSSMGIPFTACLLPENSTFGVNANIICKDEDKYWLLSYLNSSIVTYFVRGIMLRTNMITSGYVSRIPIIQLSKTTKEKLSSISREIIDRKLSKEIIANRIKKIDNIIYEDITLTKDTINRLKNFCSNIMKLT